MAREARRDSATYNDKTPRADRYTNADDMADNALDELDFLMRSTQSAEVRSLLSTAYNLLCEVSDLIQITRDLEAKFE
jgi:hypothetical protein